MHKIILGIDPGLNHTGWGVIQFHGSQISYLDSGTVHTKPTEKLPLRISIIYKKICEIIIKHKPDDFAIEETFVNKNPQSSLKLGYARASAIIAATNHDVPVYEYSAKYVKKAIVGSGSADKQQIMFMLKTLLPSASPKTEDESDALAVAISHSNCSGGL
ncbi:MAG: crossover junction endodeoxyribonuclease RuvC [Rickettsiales bacterium]